MLTSQEKARQRKTAFAYKYIYIYGSDTLHLEEKVCTLDISNHIFGRGSLKRLLKLLFYSSNGITHRKMPTKENEWLIAIYNWEILLSMLQGTPNCQNML